MNLETLTGGLVLLPGCVFLTLAAAWLLGWNGNEKVLTRVTQITYALLTVGVLTLGWKLGQQGFPTLAVSFGNWFQVAHYGFPLTLLIDRLSLPMATLTIVLVGLVGSFSVRYLHRDPGYFRFFLLLHLYGFGSLLLFTAGSLDLLVAGWELVGITSVLLIGFFQQRQEPVRNALRVFSTYRVADVFMLTAVFLVHHWFGSSLWADLFPGHWPQHAHILHGPGASLVCLLLILAACGKSSQGPFSGWLPRAMEGPTPSSAVFYGAISVHGGAYLLLRIQPLIAESWLATSFLIFVGVTTAVLATLIHRTCVDAKTSLAYASMTQLGIIFTEVGLGWNMLALLHTVGHAVLRTAQFLRAPSMLHDYHRLHSAAGGDLGETGAHYHSFVPKSLQLWLYTVGLERGCYDALLERFILRPLIGFSRFLGWLEPADWLTRWRLRQAAAKSHASLVKPTLQEKAHV
jgi:NADH:ubiquinone oxidoreductase subunit 5 (subunit L)/multisubunit Na+/H+ antiporter MnhA subunit